MSHPYPCFCAECDEALYEAAVDAADDGELSAMLWLSARAEYLGTQARHTED